MGLDMFERLFLISLIGAYCRGSTRIEYNLANGQTAFLDGSPWV